RSPLQPCIRPPRRRGTPSSDRARCAGRVRRARAPAAAPAPSGASAGRRRDLLRPRVAYRRNRRRGSIRRWRTPRSAPAAAARCEASAQADRLLERTGRRDTLGDDVESRPVRRRRERYLEACGERDATIEALELRRDLSLIVVHREHAVELASERLEEHGI